MRFGFATAVLAAILPITALAQGVIPASAEQILRGSAALTTPYARLPVSMDDSLPGEASWSEKAAAWPNRSLPPDSQAAAAMQVQPECCPEGEQPRQGLIRRLLAIPKQPWCNAQFFTAGNVSVEVLSGFFQSPIWVSSPRQTFFVPEFVRLGLVLNDPDPERRLLKGSFAALAEFDCMPVTFGVGSIVIGGSGIVRYYQKPWKNVRMVTYVQAGFGGTWSDAYLNPISPTTSAFNFITQVGMGSHFFLRRNLALTNETSYYRISFPNQAVAGNPGFNILGSTIGLTYFFNKD
jgi:hypothetical protein